MKKTLKICLISVVFVILTLIIGAFLYFFVNYVKFSKIPLDTMALSSPSLSIEVYDSENHLLSEQNTFNGEYISLEKIPTHTKEAFLSIEDKDFYRHNGLNKKRILKAMYNNLKSFSLKEGASTISQQLIKNTHLSGEKTFERKIKEMALTKKLEKNFLKDEILECYLNVIYFGNNCYGIERASNFYFNKSAENLNLNESCLLAGMIKSPNKYSPILHADSALKRRNLVLKEMEKDGKIGTDTRINAEKEEIKLSINQTAENKLNSYSQASIDEAMKILNLPAKSLAIGGYKIHTYQNKEEQSALESALSSTDFGENDHAGIVIDNASHGVVAYVGKSAYKILDAKRQVGSCIKPILVYAPALNENVITPETEINDEKLSINSYSPQNVGGKYAGYVTVTDSVKNSINTVAVKVLSYIGIDTGKMYAERMGFTFDEKDSSYALALGGMTYGENLKTLTNAYTTFANSGKYATAKFVEYILDKDGRLVYRHTPKEKEVLRSDSAFLMTDMLRKTAESGTAKKLSGIKNTEIASKTGTVGNKNGNLDAYNISYTPSYTIGVWCGNLNNKLMKINGGNEPTSAVKKFVKKITPKVTKFTAPSVVREAKIDLIEKEENHRVLLASPDAPERYTKTALFSAFNLPKEVSSNFVKIGEIDATCKREKDNCALSLSAKRHIIYDIFLNGEYYRTVKDKNEKILITLPLKKEENEILIKAHFQMENSPIKEKQFVVASSSTWHKEKDWWEI